MPCGPITFTRGVTTLWLCVHRDRLVWQAADWDTGKLYRNRRYYDGLAEALKKEGYWKKIKGDD